MEWKDGMENGGMEEEWNGMDKNGSERRWKDGMDGMEWNGMEMARNELKVQLPYQSGRTQAIFPKKFTPGLLFS